jgi:predicted RNA-binding Zn ribbon-like protein
VRLDSYGDAGLVAALKLVNQLAAGPAASLPPEGQQRAIARILAVDPPSVARLDKRDRAGFVALADALRPVFRDLSRGAVDAAARRVNGLLARYPAHPHLAKEGGRWRLHHHPADTDLVPMWAASCAEAVARMIGAGHAGRFGACAAPGCGRAYFDVSKNASRRFCSTTCQNRVKAASFRVRRGAQSRKARAR